MIDERYIARTGCRYGWQRAVDRWDVDMNGEGQCVDGNWIWIPLGRLKNASTELT